MFLKNNSKNSWLGYNCGICIVDILPESTFEVTDQAGEFILKNLGCSHWITKIEKIENAEKVVEEKVLAEVKTVFKKKK